jgi:hypothetical protein
VPSSEEDHFKFFHRSFFEYFYSQHIVQAMHSSHEIFEAMSAFDIDSEIIELTLSAYKQKQVIKYINFVEFILDKTEKELEDNNITTFQYLILVMQIVTEPPFLNRFIGILKKYKSVIIDQDVKRKIKVIPSLISVLKQSDGAITAIAASSKEIAEKEFARFLLGLNVDFIRKFASMDKDLLLKNSDETSDDNIVYSMHMLSREIINANISQNNISFYTGIYVSVHPICEMVNAINEIVNSDDQESMAKKNQVVGSPKKLKKRLSKLNAIISIYLSLSDKSRIYFDKIILEYLMMLSFQKREYSERWLDSRIIIDEEFK